MLNKRNYIIAGTLAKPHGVEGEISVRLSSEVMSHDLDPSFVYLEIDNGLVPFRVSSFRYKADDVLLIKLPLLSSEKKIRAYMGSAVYVSPREVSQNETDLNTLDAFTSYQVIDTKVGEIGQIEGIQDISGNPLFIINSKQGELLIPVADEFIVKIDDNAKTIEMNIPEGLLDLNN